MVHTERRPQYDYQLVGNKVQKSMCENGLGVSILPNLPLESHLGKIVKESTMHENDLGLNIVPNLSLESHIR